MKKLVGGVAFALALVIGLVCVWFYASRQCLQGMWE